MKRNFRLNLRIQFAFLLCLQLASMNANAEKVMAYRCRAKCIAVDYKQNSFQFVYLPSQLTPVTQFSKQNQEDAFDAYEQQCVRKVNELCWSTDTTSAILTFNRQYHIHSQTINYERTHFGIRQKWNQSELDSIIQSPSVNESCKPTTLEASELPIQYYSGNLNIGG